MTLKHIAALMNFDHIIATMTLIHIIATMTLENTAALTQLLHFYSTGCPADVIACDVV
jgi:hypothetical protein